MGGGFDGPFDPEYLSRVDYFCPNETELARIVNMRTETREEVKAAVEEFKSKFKTQNVLVSRGTNGSILFTPDEEISQEPFPASVQDTTAAGDSFDTDSSEGPRETSAY